MSPTDRSQFNVPDSSDDSVDESHLPPLSRADVDNAFALEGRGLVDPLSSVDPVERFTIPRIPSLDGVRKVAAALRQAMDHRKGVVVTSPPGHGKSEGAHAARSTHLLDERALAERNRAHRIRRVVYVNLRTSRSKRQMLIDLLRKATPGRAVRDRSHGLRLDDDELRDLLYRTYRQQNVVAVIFDDAHRMSDAGLELVRDLIASSEDDPHRARPDAMSAYTSAPGQYPRAEIATVGVGVVLLGLPAIRTRLEATGETHGNGRWIFRSRVKAVPSSKLAGIYESFLPGFGPHIAEVSRPVWQQFIASHVANGREVPIRLVATHVREYFARLYDHSRGAITTRESAPFDRALFLEALRAVQWADSAQVKDVLTTESRAADGVGEHAA